MVRPVVWRPPAEPSPAEQAVIKAVRRARLFVFLRQHRHELFDERFQAELVDPLGEVIPALINANLLREKIVGEVLGIVFVVRDIRG